MRNYYEILEVAKNASPEVIEKAYKTLIKKYHPDLQPEDKKKDAENKVKLINEAYDILSNPAKKSEYDEKLQQIEHQKEIERQKQTQTNTSFQTQINNTKQNQTQSSNSYNQEIDRINAVKKAYNDAYINTLRNMGYKIRYKKTFKDYLKSTLKAIILIFCIIIICIILWHIPFIKKSLLDLYNSNEFIKIPVDIIHNIFSNFISLFKK